MKRVFILFILSVLLTGCSKTTDIEDRNYAMVLGLDEVDGKLLATYSFADLGKIAESKGARPQGVSLSIQGRSLKAVEETYQSFQDKKLELGHLKAVILGKKLVENEHLKNSILWELENNEEYPKTILVYTTKETAKDFIQVEEEIQASLGDYLNNMFYNNLAKGQKRPITLETLLRSKNEGESTGVPSLVIKDKRPSIDSYDLFIDGHITQNISRNNYQLLMLLKGDTPYESLLFNGGYVTFVTVKAKGDNPIELTGTINIEGEYSQRQINAEIKNQIENNLFYFMGETVSVKSDFKIQ